MILNIGNDIKYSVLDLLREIGIAFVNIIFDTIDVLYNVAQKINSLDFIKMLEENSSFVNIFNAFLILSFILLFLFSVWKLTFRILDVDTNEQPLFELVKEIVKCTFLIFSIYLIFNTTTNLGMNLSNAIYNNFKSNSSMGEKMKTSYLTINEACYKREGGEDTDKENVSNLKEKLGNYGNFSSINTMKDFENLIRNESLTVKKVFDSGAFSNRCKIYKPGKWNDGEDYSFSYNFVFAIVIGSIFLFATAFAVLMLGKRQIELAFLLLISPIVIATSVSRKEQRSALYQQLTSLTLQAGAVMLLIGLTTILFNIIQNNSDINNLSYFTKIVTQSILYISSAILLMTGSSSLNRFIGENISANNGRDMMMAMKGITNGISNVGSKSMAIAGMTRGVGELAKGGFQSVRGGLHGVASIHPEANSKLASKMNNRVSKGLGQMMAGSEMQHSKNPLTQMYGKMLEGKGEKSIENASKQWDFQNNRYNVDYMKNGVSQAKKGMDRIKNEIRKVRR